MSNDQHIESLAEIRTLMQRSSRFISLSGLSGVAAGIFALLGAWAANDYYFKGGALFGERLGWGGLSHQTTIEGHMNHAIGFFVADALIVLIASLTVAWILTRRKAKKDGLKMWDKSAQRLLFALFVPLFAGGAVCLALFYHGSILYIAPCMLVFYGLGLVSASQHTLKDIQYLGFSELILGIAGLFFLGKGLLFWAIGFGILHIVYGLLMYIKYER